MNTIYYATSNAGKFRCVENFFKTHHPEIKVEQFKFDAEEIQSSSQKKVALNKAQQAFDALKKPLLVDDAGVYFQEYNNFPGTITKFLYKGVGFDGIFKLINENSKVSLILTLVYIDGEKTITFEGRCDGTVIKPNTDGSDIDNSIPWEFVFIPEGQQKTYYQLRGTDLFNETHFRLRALRKFIDKTSLVWKK